LDAFIIISIVILSILLFVGIWALLSYRKLYGHYFNFWIILFIVLIPTGAAQEGILEEPGFVEADPFGGNDIPIDPGPLVFPEEMPKAAVAVEQIVTDIFCPTCAAEEDAWRAGIMAFLGNDSQNLTRINLTA
jgi:hypothetical protein